MSLVSGSKKLFFSFSYLALISLSLKVLLAINCDEVSKVKIFAFLTKSLVSKNYLQLYLE